MTEAESMRFGAWVVAHARQKGRNFKRATRVFKRHVGKDDAAALADVAKNPKLALADTWRDLDNGATLLHLAAAAGSVEVCEVLIAEYGADVRAVDLTGRLALHYAAAKHHTAVCELLLEKMGDPRGPASPADMAGLTPSGTACLATAKRGREDAKRGVRRWFCQHGHQVPHERTWLGRLHLVVFSLCHDSSAVLRGHERGEKGLERHGDRVCAPARVSGVKERTFSDCRSQ